MCLPHRVFVGFQYPRGPLLPGNPILAPRTASQLYPGSSQAVKQRALPQTPICPLFSVLGRLWFGYTVVGLQTGLVFESKQMFLMRSCKQGPAHAFYLLYLTPVAPSKAHWSFACPAPLPAAGALSLEEVVPARSESTHSVPPERLALSERHCAPCHRACFGSGWEQLPSLSRGICGKAQMIGLGLWGCPF